MAFRGYLVLMGWCLVTVGWGQANPQTELSLSSPLGFTELPPVPADNSLTTAKVVLGKRLFHDPMLSGNGQVSCATCHKEELNFATNDPLAIGIDNRVGTRNTPTLLNRAYAKSLFWDGRSATLEDQALQPIENRDEMGATIAEVLTRLQNHAEYPGMFAQAFSTEHAVANGSPVTRDNLAKALAAYQRTLLSGGSQVDRFRANDYSALSPEARQGLWLFESKGGCWQCHSTDNFTDEEFHNTGVGFGRERRDLGRFEKTRNPADRFRFKTPTLRGVAKTAPYMHDGSVLTLDEVVEFYSRGGAPDDPLLDPKLKPLNLSEVEKKQLVAFLKALSE